MSQESLELEHSLRKAVEEAKAELVEKNHELRRARNALQKELASRTEDLAQLTQELIDSKKDLISTKDELAAELVAMNRLHELSTALLGQTELKPLLEEVLNATVALQNADMGCVQLYNPITQALEIVVQRGFRQDFLDCFRGVHDDTTVCGRAMLSRERVIVEDVLTDPGFAPHKAMALAAGYRSVQSTPLFSRSGEPLGMISTYFRNPHRPSDRELRLSDLYAREAAEMIERKRAEEELSRANANTTEILESITDGFSAWDQNWRYIYVNERSAQLLGKPREQLIGRSVWELFPEAVGTEAYHKCQQAMAEHLPVYFEACFYNRWYENHVYPTKEGLSVYWREITDRKQAEEALRESNRRSKNILESITDEFNAFDREWRFIYVNQAALNAMQRVKGEELRLEEVLGKNVWEMFPAHVGSPVYQKYQEAMREQKTVPFEAWSPVSGRWLEGRAYPSDEGLSVYYRDITERKRTEEQLRYHAYLLENVHDAVIATDERLAVTAWNKGAEQMYGWRADEAVGRHIWEVVPVDLSDGERAEALRELEEKGRFRAEAVTYRKDGTPVYVEGITIALRGQQEEGRITGYVNIRRDITEPKRAEEALRASTRRIENILESITDQFYAMDREWRFTYINERALVYMRRLKGEAVTREDLLGTNVWKLYPELVGSIYYQKYHEAVREQKTVQFEVYYPPNDTWAEMHAYPSEEGLSVYWQDITERKRAEEKLQRSEAYLAEAQRLSHTGSWSWNVSTEELFWSAEHFRILGLHPEKTPPPYPAILEYIHPEDRSFVQKTLDDAMRARSDFHVNCRIVRPDETIRHIESFARPFFNPTGEVTEYVGTIIDITEREQSEQILQENRQRLRVALESSPVAFTILRAARHESCEIIDFEWLYLNPVAARILGRGAEELIGRRVRQVFPDSWEAHGLFDCFVQVVNTGEPREIEVRSRRNGVDAWFQNIAAKLGDGVAVWFADITDRKRTEEALRRSEAFLAEGQKISHTGSWLLSFPSWEVFWSREMFRIYGLDPANTKISQEIAFLLIHPEDRQFVKEKFERAVRDKSDFAVEHRAMLPDGTLKHLSALGHPVINESGGLVEYVGTVVDISDRKRAEESLRTAYAELANATRVTMMGELAASIAHEINQPLGAITNNGNAGLHLAAAMPGSAHELREVLTEIVNDAERASAIIRRIRALVQRSAMQGSWLQVGDVIAEALALAHRKLVDNRITAATEFSDDLPRIWGDRIQLQQVLLNLILNAVEAMSAVEDDRRVLIIRAQRDSLEDKPAVLVSIEDRGGGFTPEDGERLFDAFFTTKQHGLGMGLRISRSIVEAYGGRLWATSNAGPGATLHCALPVGEERVA